MPPLQPTSPQTLTGNVVVFTSVLNSTTWTSTFRKSSTRSWSSGALTKTWPSSCLSMLSTRSRRFVQLSEISFEPIVKTNCELDPGIRRLDEERQEVPGRVKPKPFILSFHALRPALPVLFPPSALVLCH